METVAWRKPVRGGLKVIWKVCVPPCAATVAEAGCWVTLKSEAWAPKTETRGEPVSVKSPDPVLIIENVCTGKPVLMSVLPKSVPFGTDVDVTPSTMEMPFPLISISGAAEPVPCILKLYGFSSGSLFAMEIVAVLMPVALGSNRTTKTELPPLGLILAAG